jgi:hypothetical protein
MTVDPGEAKLAPGASLTVNLMLELGYREGSYVHQVMIYTNDPARPVTRVDVKLMVPMAVKFTPRANLIGLVPRGPELATRRFELGIYAADKKTLEPPRVTSTSAYLSVAEVVPQKAPNGLPYHLVKLALDPSIPYGDYSESLLVETMHPDQPKLTIPVRWRIAYDLVAPDPVDPGVLEEGRPTTGVFTVRNLGTRSVNVLRAVAKLGVPAEVKVAPKDKDLEVTLSLPEGPRAWTLRGFIELHTDHPDHPVFPIRVEGKVWARDPFARMTVDQAGDTEFFEVLKEALLNEEALPMPRVLKGVLGGYNDSRVTAILLRALREGEYFPIRARAAEALGLLKSTRALDALMRAATDDVDDDVRRQAATAVVRMLGKEALPLLELVMLDEEEFTREHGTVLLGEIDDPRSVRLLQTALDDPELIVVESAKKSLKLLGAEDLVR